MTEEKALYQVDHEVAANSCHEPFKRREYHLLPFHPVANGRRKDRYCVGFSNAGSDTNTAYRQAPDATWNDTVPAIPKANQETL
jgi:hypothetical protein